MGIFQGLIDFITGVFKGNWSAAWEGVVSIFKNIIDGIVAIIKFPINQMITLINTFLDGLNGIEIPDWVPGVGGMSLRISPIPMLERGAYSAPDTFIAGDVNGRGGELITGARGRRVFTAAETGNIFNTLREIAGLNGTNASSGVLQDIAVNVSSIASMISSLSSALGMLDHGLNYAGAMGAGTVQNIYNQQTFDMRSNYTINDVSGRPQAVAAAVDRTQALRIRNFQGIYSTT
jgi:hypothetical protein